jgi:cytochrome c oxidase cbb3-type subunit 3
MKPARERRAIARDPVRDVSQRWHRRLGSNVLARGGAVAMLLAGALTGCQRESRDFDSGIEVPSATASKAVQRDYEGNAYALTEGKRLYSSFNCSGCHANGGGGIGPPLLDSPWRYGSELPQIFDTIMDGRPNGMPAFRGKITHQQGWQLAGYVRSLSGQISKATAPSRSDHMKANPPENSVDPVPPTKEPGLPRKAP